jgi:hypothetical protein
VTITTKPKPTTQEEINTLSPIEHTHYFADMLFDTLLAAQQARYLIFVLGKPLHIHKLAQLLYLNDRASTNDSITNDSPIATEYGMSLFRIHKLLYKYDYESELWDNLIEVDDDDMVSLGETTYSEQDVTQISDYIQTRLHETIDSYGLWTKEQLTDYTKSLPEWSEPPKKGIIEISYRDYYKILGKTPEEIEGFIEQMEEYGHIAWFSNNHKIKAIK